MNTATAEAPVDAILSPVRELMLPDTEALNRGANAAVRMADSFVVASQEDYGMAAEELAAIKGKWNKLEAQRTTITVPMNKALTAINALFKGPMDLLKSAEATIKHSMLTYSNEQERIAAEARRVAEQAAAVERARIAAEAREVESKAAAERTRIANEEAERVRKATEEREALEAQAVEAQKSGDTAALAAIEQQVGTLLESSEIASQQAREQSEEVEQNAIAESASLRMEAAVTSTQVSRVPVAAAKGVSKTTTWDFELIDLSRVVAHIAAHPELVNLLTLDTVKTRAYVKSLGENCKIPGLNVFQKSGISSRAA